MCSPSQKRHKNGPMIYVCSRALQWISCSFLEAPGQCDHQARNDTKMDQWSAFIPAHFSWPRVVFCRRQYNVLTKSETTQKWTNDLRLFPRTSVDLMQFFGSARTMWSPSQKRYQNGPMICVHSRALQLASCSFLQAPVQCAHQVRNDTKMDQWSTFVPAHFSGSHAVFWKRQDNVITKPETIPKWTNDLRSFPRTSVGLV